MALENASYPTQLVTSNPQGGDQESQGDNHIRLIKGVLKTTFPNFGAPLTATAAQLAILADSTKQLFPGIIAWWSGTLSNIPAGWKLCNGVGTTSNGIAIPDLRARFVVGAGGVAPVGPVAGSTGHQHTATPTINNHTLVIAEIPGHQHDASAGTGSRLSDAQPQNTDTIGQVSASGTSGLTGGNQPHTHGATLTIAQNSHLPPYLVKALIIKN